MKFEPLRNFIKKRIYLIIFLSFFVFSVIYFAIIPRANTLIRKTRELEMLKEQGHIENLQNSKLSTIDWVIEKIPDKNPLYDFIIEIEKLTKKNDLALSRIRTKDEFNDDEAIVVPVTIVLKGVYPSLLSFIQAIEEYHSVVDINTVQLKLSSQDKDFEPNDIGKRPWELIVEVNIYYLIT